MARAACCGQGRGSKPVSACTMANHAQDHASSHKKAGGPHHSKSILPLWLSSPPETCLEGRVVSLGGGVTFPPLLELERAACEVLIARHAPDHNQGYMT